MIRNVVFFNVVSDLFKCSLWGYVPIATFYVNKLGAFRLSSCLLGTITRDTHLAYFGRLFEDEVAVLFHVQVVNYKTLIS